MNEPKSTKNWANSKIIMTYPESIVTLHLAKKPIHQSQKK
jgi:hypothetical protein